VNSLLEKETESTIEKPTNNETKNSETNHIPSEVATKPEKKEILYTKKTLKEIEKEIAENTAKFDENALKKNEVEVVEKSDDNNKTKTSEDEKKIENLKKVIVQQQSSIQPSQLNKLVTMFLIFTIAIYGGIIFFHFDYWFTLLII
jgi:hypothetical protein